MTDLLMGVMTGTSLDGIDVVVTRSPGCSDVIHSNHVTMPLALTKALSALSTQYGQPHSLIEIKHLEQAFTQQIAFAIKQTLSDASLSAKDIVAAGVHGLTVCHAPDHSNPFTWQLLDAHKLAVEIGIDVIYDFRAKDIALGGQGAPLVPPFHRQLFHQFGDELAVLNLGGIANVTAWPNGSENLIGFDTGPANTLLDGWIAAHQEKPYDKNGDWAASGKLVTGLLEQMLTEPYFAKPFPKSTGKELFNANWLAQQCSVYTAAMQQQSQGAEDLEAVDVQCTLTHLTAKTVANSLNKLGKFKMLAVCGGGVHNQFLMQLLDGYLPACEVKSSLYFGVCPDNLEALAFAWLAYCRLNDKKGSAPSVTGASTSAVLGAWVRAH